MKKIFFILFILSLLENLTESINNPSYYSNLIGKVRKELVYRSLLHLPKRNDINFLKMVLELIQIKEDNSFNDTESAYFIYKWICNNIELEKNNGSREALKTNELGKGDYKGISLLFSKICSYFNLESNIIKEDSRIGLNDTRNYVKIDNEYYLIDIPYTIIYKEIESISFYKDLFFGTEPSVFINYHFPSESKWQLLQSPITNAQYKYMVKINPNFHY